MKFIPILHRLIKKNHTGINPQPENRSHLIKTKKSFNTMSSEYNF